MDAIYLDRCHIHTASSTDRLCIQKKKKKRSK